MHWCAEGLALSVPFIAHAGVTCRPGIYAFYSIMSMHICSNSSNISSNWHCMNMLVCSCVVTNVAGAYWLGTTKPLFTDVSSSSDSCLELGTNTVSKLHDCFFYCSVLCHNQAMYDCQALPIHIGFQYLVCSIRYIPFLGLWGQRITYTLGSFHAGLAINALLQLTT